MHLETLSPSLTWLGATVVVVSVVVLVVVGDRGGVEVVDGTMVWTKTKGKETYRGSRRICVSSPPPPPLPLIPYQVVVVVVAFGGRSSTQ